MEKVIGILDTDEHYVLRLCSYLSQKHLVPYKAMAFTSLDSFLSCKNDYELEVVLASETFQEALQGAVTACPCVFLSEEASDPEAFRINRYQGTDHLVKELFAFLNGGSPASALTASVPLTAVYAPSGRCGRTTLALAYAMIQSKTRRILYVNLEEYASLEQLFGPPKKGLSDALYYYLSDHNNIGKIISCISHFQDFDYFYPTANPEDLADLTAADLFGMLDLLRDGTLYDEIVVDLGGLIRQPWLVLEQCARIMEPVLEFDAMSQKKADAFRFFLENSRYQTILAQITILKLPYIQQLAAGDLSIEALSSLELKQLLRRYFHD